MMSVILIISVCLLDNKRHCSKFSLQGIHGVTVEQIIADEITSKSKLPLFSMGYQSFSFTDGAI